MQWQDFVFSINRAPILECHGQKLVIEDFEVVGAYGLRRLDFVTLCKNNQVLVRQSDFTNEDFREFYNEDLGVLSTLAKFELEKVSRPDFATLALSYFKYYFPLTNATLDSDYGVFKNKLLQDYLSQVKRNSFLLADIFVYLGPFFKSRFAQNPELISCADLDSLNLSIDTREFVQPASLGIVQSNPNLHILRLDRDLPKAKLTKALWALGVTESFKKFQVQLQPVQALMLDVLDRDWSMNVTEFTEAMKQAMKQHEENLKEMQGIDIDQEIQKAADLGILLLPK